MAFFKKLSFLRNGKIHLGLYLVVAFAWDAVADATTGVRRVAVVAGDEVEVEVEDGLACGGAGVHTDVVTIR